MQGLVYTALILTVSFSGDYNNSKLPHDGTVSKPFLTTVSEPSTPTLFLLFFPSFC